MDECKKALSIYVILDTIGRMAGTRTRTKTATYSSAESSTSSSSPLPSGERRAEDLKKVEISHDYESLLYVVHPSVIDGDPKHTVRDQLQALVDSQEGFSRIIVIVPPQDCVYLREGTVVNDTRMSNHEGNWVESADLAGEVQKVTLVGGNIELCLGSVSQEIRRFTYAQEANYPERDCIEIILPLDSIYSRFGVSAETLMHDLLRHGTPLEAAIALLTTTTPRTGTGTFAYGDFEIVPSNGSGTIEISLNGTKLGILNPKRIETSQPDIPHTISEKLLFDPRSQLENMVSMSLRVRLQPLRTVLKINLTMPQTTPVDPMPDTTLSWNPNGKIAHARYVMEQNDVEVVKHV